MKRISCRHRLPPHCGNSVRNVDAGFTLVEVLVAMFVMAILAVMAWRGIDGISRTREASQSRLDQTLRLTTVLGQWEQDLVLVPVHADAHAFLDIRGADSLSQLDHEFGDLFDVDDIFALV